MRYYLDYNSTSPLASSVKGWLKESELPFANASSIHSSGKASRALITQTTDFLSELFNAADFQIFYHSGASEGINTIIKGWCLSKEKAHVFCSMIDHASALKCQELLERFAVEFHLFPIDKNGNFDKEKLIAEIKSCEGPVLLNYTWVNNVTGVVWDLKWAEEIKRETGATIHVDSVQVPGKIKNWNEINPNLDYYTYSGHKFGALKGVGFTFFKTDFMPLIQGGGQQNGKRSGTENVMGVYSLKLALEEMLSKSRPEELSKAKMFLENSLREFLGEEGTVVASNSPRNNNTILFLQRLEAPEIVQIAFDQEGLELGTGSACSSGIQVPDRILLAHGYSKEDALRGFRLSLGPFSTLALAETIWPKIEAVLQRFRTVQ